MGPCPCWLEEFHPLDAPNHARGHQECRGAEDRHQPLESRHRHIAADRAFHRVGSHSMLIPALPEEGSTCFPPLLQGGSRTRVGRTSARIPGAVRGLASARPRRWPGRRGRKPRREFRHPRPCSPTRSPGRAGSPGGRGSRGGASGFAWPQSLSSTRRRQARGSPEGGGPRSPCSRCGRLRWPPLAARGATGHHARHEDG